MRRFFLAATILSIVAGGPLQARAGDREIAEQIIQRLKVQRDAGDLKDFTLDLKVDKGVVLMRGNVRQPAQKQNVLAVAKGIEGIAKVVDEITVTSATPDVAKPDPTASVVRPKAAVAKAPQTQSPAKQNPEASKPAEGMFSFKDAIAANPPKPVTASSADAKTLVPMPQNAKPAVAPLKMIEADPAQAEVAQASRPAPWQAKAGVEMAAATEAESSVDKDRAVTSAVVGALGAAQRQGRLKGFGVDVNTQDGRVYLNGRASSEQHRDLITSLARQTPGVVEVVDEIVVYDSSTAIPHPVGHENSGEPAPLTEYAPNLTPVNVQPVPNGGRGSSRPGTPAITAAARQMQVPAQTVPYSTQGGQMQGGQMQGGPMQGGQMQMTPAAYGVAGCMPGGTPSPMSPYAGGAAAPRYEQPYLPNYAWPGYAAYPNYAAVTYPQQYSPSAWPYIGPFYPYPQVPLGWRKVSLEWDDGWWMLDFTDR